jgi:hypothetical protein
MHTATRNTLLRSVGRFAALLLAALVGPATLRADQDCLPHALSADQEAAYRHVAAQVQPYITHELDLADDLQYRYVLHQMDLAGESREKSPELYRRLDAAHQEKHQREPRPPLPDRAFATANSGELVPLNVIDSFLTRVQGGQHDYAVSALSSYPGGTDQTSIFVNLAYQPQGGGPPKMLACQEGTTTQYADGVNFRVNAEGDLPADAASRDVTANVMFQVSQGDNFKTYTLSWPISLNATAACLSQPMYPGQSGCLNDSTMNRDNPLVMCYHRTPGQGQDCASYSPEDHPRSYPFPLKGWATFQDQVDQVVGVFLTLHRPTGGGGCMICGMASGSPRQCPGGAGTIKASDVTKSGNKIEWDWTGANGGTLASFPNGADCIQNTDVADITHMTLAVSVLSGGTNWSNVEFKSAKAANFDPTVDFPLPDIDILQGCLARGTRIRLADGSERTVESFLGGGAESVRSRGPGARRRVLGNTRGIEPIPIVRIEDEDGRSLLLTEGHPVLTEGGVVAARDLEVDQVVLTEAGPRRLVGVGRQRYDGEIFNLKLEGSEEQVAAGETTMVANGFVVGDLQMQRHFARLALVRRGERSVPEILEVLPPEWHRDFLNDVRPGGN